MVAALTWKEKTVSGFIPFCTGHLIIWEDSRLKGNLQILQLTLGWRLLCFSVVKIWGVEFPAHWCWVEHHQDISKGLLLCFVLKWAYELLQKWFSNSCCNCSYLTLTSQKLDLDLILEAGSLVLKYPNGELIYPFLYPPLFFLPILEYEPVTFRAPLYLICTLCVLDCLCLEVDSLPGWEFGCLAGVSDVSLVVKLLSLLTMSSIMASFPRRPWAALLTLLKKIKTIESQPQVAEPGDRNRKLFCSGIIGSSRVEWLGKQILESSESVFF